LTHDATVAISGLMLNKDEVKMGIQNKCDDKITTEEIWDRLMDHSEEWAKEGATPQDVATVMAFFVVELSFDCAPSHAEATHLLLSAINARIERDREDDEDDS